MKPSELPIIGHIASLLLAVGFLIFLHLILRKTRKVYKRGKKAQRRLKQAGKATQP
jgi:hypothetical protein